MSILYRGFIRNNNLRFFSRSCIRKETNKAATKLEKNPTGSQSNQNLGGFDTISVGPLEKFYLVWSGKYKSKAEVPNRVSQSEFSNARTKCRIKIANYSMIGFVILSIVYSFKGKFLASKGETFSKPSIERHQTWEKERNEKNN